MQRVLIVEDDRKLCSAVARSLRLLSCDVVPTHSVDGALRCLVAEPAFDVVLLDVRLGTRSGVEVARAAAELIPAPAVVATSGEASREEMFELGRLGVRAFVDKSELMVRIGELLELASQPSPLEPHAKTQVGHGSVVETVNRVRTAMLMQALGIEGGSCARASVKLGVSRQAVQQLLHREKERGNA